MTKATFTQFFDIRISQAIMGKMNARFTGDYPKNCVNLQAGVELRNISLEVYEYVEKEPDS